MRSEAATLCSRHARVRVVCDGRGEREIRLGPDGGYINAHGRLARPAAHPDVCVGGACGWMSSSADPCLLVERAVLEQLLDKVDVRQHHPAAAVPIPPPISCSVGIASKQSGRWGERGMQPRRVRQCCWPGGAKQRHQTAIIVGHAAATTANSPLEAQGVERLAFRVLGLQEVEIILPFVANHLGPAMMDGGVCVCV